MKNRWCRVETHAAAIGATRYARASVDAIQAAEAAAVVVCAPPRAGAARESVKMQ